jgi:P-type E1-E2 ATPase
MMSIALTQSRLMKSLAYVKNLQATEIAGRVTQVLCDKTGTLTHNRMDLTNIWVGCERGNDRRGLND